MTITFHLKLIFYTKDDIEGVKNVLGLAEQDRMFIFPPYIASLIPFLLEKDVAHAESTFKYNFSLSFLLLVFSFF